jgi:putative transposase
MLKAFKYRLDPDRETAALINKHFGCAKWVYKVFSWLKEVNKQSFQMALRNLYAAFQGFFQEKTSGFKYTSEKHIHPAVEMRRTVP